MLIATGRPFPAPLPPGEGPLFALDQTGGMLVVKWNNPTHREIRDVCEGRCEVALFVDRRPDEAPLPFLLARFQGQNWLEMPFNLYLQDRETWPDLERAWEPGTGLNILAFTVEALSRVVVSQLRAFVLPHALTVQFWAALRQQMAAPDLTRERQQERIQDVYRRFSSPEAMAAAAVVAGEVGGSGETGI